MQGPNVKKLIAHKMSIDAIPAGGGLADGIQFLSDPAKIIEGAKAATAWVNAAIQAVRNAVVPNPWKGNDDETIAGMLLSEIAKKKAKR